MSLNAATPTDIGTAGNHDDPSNNEPIYFTPREIPTVPYTRGFKGHNQNVISVIKHFSGTGTAWFAVDSITGQGTLDMNTA
jgi:hypothetical protein